MADEPAAIVIAPVEPEPESEQEFEVTKEWVESLFAENAAILSGVREGLQIQTQVLTQLSERMTVLETRMPENLLTLMESDRATIRELIREQAEILKGLLTPPPVIVPAVEPVPEPVAEVVHPAAATVPENPPSRKRRVI